MPNWSKNRLTISGKREEIEKCLKAIGSENGAIDFEKIIPMPLELKDVVSGTNLDRSMNLIKKEQSGEKLSPEEEKFLEEKDFEEQTSNRENAALALSCLEKYGYRDWYDWAIANWGTKWNADARLDVIWISQSDDKAMCEIIFATAWSAPLPVIKKVSEMFPNLILREEAYDCSMAWGLVYYYTGGNWDMRIEGDFAYNCDYYTDEEDSCDN